MDWGPSRLLRTWLLAMLALLCAFPAGAEERAPATCHAFSASAMPVAQALEALEWNCSDTGWEEGPRDTAAHQTTDMRFVEREPAASATRSTTGYKGGDGPSRATV